MTIDVVSADWPMHDVLACTTTRDGGVSRGRYATLNLAAHVGDDDAAVAANRRRMRDALDLEGEPLWLDQVHGATVVDAADVAADDPPPTADAVVSRDGLRTLGILTADCLPILLCSVANAEIAALHCGWRSLSSGIVAETVDALDSAGADLIAWLGPAISAPAFEVGDEVREAFLAGVGDADACFTANERGRWQADLYGLARRYLAAAGVERVYGGGLCTYGDSRRYFSYRRDGRCGRMATLIRRR